MDLVFNLIVQEIVSRIMLSFHFALYFSCKVLETRIRDTSSEWMVVVTHKKDVI